jgi:hypothetical protein
VGSPAWPKWNFQPSSILVLVWALLLDMETANKQIKSTKAARVFLKQYIMNRVSIGLGKQFTETLKSLVCILQ